MSLRRTLLAFAVLAQCCRGLVLDRRSILAVAGSLASTVPSWWVAPSWADEEAVPFERRNREGNKQAVIREDYYYMMGRVPPRKLESGMLKSDNPEYNAFGTCQTETGNSCTYVSLKQRIPAYTKYGFNIALGAKEYQQLGLVLKKVESDPTLWQRAESYVSSDVSPPPPAIDALLKMVLFATAMLTSPTYTGPSKELLVARFYVNEVGFATRELEAAIVTRDATRARDAWEFGKDSWNSYFVIVNRAIVPKVGDPFVPIE